MGVEVKYLGDATPVLVLGEGAPHPTSNDGGRTTTEVPTVRIARVTTEDVDGAQLLDAPPELHPDTGRPLSETADPAAASAAPEHTYTDNGNGTWTRDDGATGTFGPTGFAPTS